MESVSLSIGELSRRTRCKVQTIRWYEEVGLLPPPARSSGGHRIYGAAHLARLDFIRHARELGFPLDAVRALLRLSDHPDRACDEAHALAAAQLAMVEDKLRRLEALRIELARMTETCRGGLAAECRILETLADHTHGHCASPDHAGGDIHPTP
ncbi:Transcriptional regulator, MerR family [Rhodovastum atsumiense]|uniref:Helix-turn-helix domain-containing protein n=1 Tax=Rhodovastum atsumiense TaxID=504468 RepID=A0A5M6IUP4_9PROT|nr:helix-turn-helix domain-containing protein [Rhodovastum atsumiense]KAA5611982.1 helix-turn-helix domain-containing protein [Rhodovastum atsumiense]CAH2598762.1 Transcriptional regulator, MerR family [Rhodovastum atsumiense]